METLEERKRFPFSYYNKLVDGPETFKFPASTMKDSLERRINADGLTLENFFEKYKYYDKLKEVKEQIEPLRPVKVEKEEKDINKEVMYTELVPVHRGRQIESKLSWPTSRCSPIKDKTLKSQREYTATCFHGVGIDDESSKCQTSFKSIANVKREQSDSKSSSFADTSCRTGNYAYDSAVIYSKQQSGQSIEGLENIFPNGLSYNHLNYHYNWWTQSPLTQTTMQYHHSTKFTNNWQLFNQRSPQFCPYDSPRTFQQDKLTATTWTTLSPIAASNKSIEQTPLSSCIESLAGMNCNEIRHNDSKNMITALPGSGLMSANVQINTVIPPFLPSKRLENNTKNWGFLSTDNDSSKNIVKEECGVRKEKIESYSNTDLKDIIKNDSASNLSFYRNATYGKLFPSSTMETSPLIPGVTSKTCRKGKADRPLSKHRKTNEMTRRLGKKVQQNKSNSTPRNDMLSKNSLLTPEDERSRDTSAKTDDIDVNNLINMIDPETDIMEKTFLNVPNVYPSYESLEPLESEEEAQVKRPMNAFMIWARKYRGMVAKEFSKASNSDISVKLGEIWNRLSSEQQKPYFERAEELKIQHRYENPSYTYQPRCFRKKNKKNKKKDDEDEEIYPNFTYSQGFGYDVKFSDMPLDKSDMLPRIFNYPRHDNQSKAEEPRIVVPKPIYPHKAKASANDDCNSSMATDDSHLKLKQEAVEETNYDGDKETEDNLSILKKKQNDKDHKRRIKRKRKCVAKNDSSSSDEDDVGLLRDAMMPSLAQGDEQDLLHTDDVTFDVTDLDNYLAGDGGGFRDVLDHTISDNNDPDYVPQFKCGSKRRRRNYRGTKPIPKCKKNPPCISELTSAAFFR